MAALAVANSDYPSSLSLHSQTLLSNFFFTHITLLTVISNL